MKINKGLASTVSAVALLSAGMGGANATEASPYIIGGNEATSPWIVQLSFNSYDQSGTFGCTGEQLNDQWILTARHCVDGSYNMRVYQSNDQVNPGEPIAADRLYSAPEGDIALVHLSEKAPLSSYGKIDFNYEPAVGQQGDIYGYGQGANSSYTDTLRSARVSVIGDSYDAYNGAAVHLRGINGASNHGDSGGPFIRNGKIVAVCSTGDQADPGANINAQSNYALLSQSASWIESTTGIDFDASAPTAPVVDIPEEPEPTTPATPEPTTPANPAKPVAPVAPVAPTTPEPTTPVTPVIDDYVPGDDYIPADDYTPGVDSYDPWSWSDSWSNSWSDSWSTSTSSTTGARWNISATKTADGGTRWVSNYHWTR